MAIDLFKVNYSYLKEKKRRQYVIKDINLHIDEKDEFIALVGKTGSGKSTLATIFNALKIPTTGDAVVFGMKLKERRGYKDNYNKIRKHVGLVFQFPGYQLFEETVIKDVAFGPKNYGLKNEALDIAKKTLKMVHFPESKYESSPFVLSGGEKKLVSIAGILANDPDIIVLDEPTAGLDPRSKKNILSLLKELNEVYHKSVVVITHNMNIVYEHAKRVIVLKDGEISFDGTPYSLFNNNNDIVKNTNLDYPDSNRLAKYLNNKLKVNIKEDRKNIDELMEELIHE